MWTVSLDLTRLARFRLVSGTTVFEFTLDEPLMLMAETQSNKHPSNEVLNTIELL